MSTIYDKRNKEIHQNEKRLDILYRWIRLQQSGIRIEQLFQNRNIKNIAIYGYDMLAEILVYELDRSHISIKGIIDRRGDRININFPAFTLPQAIDLDIDSVVVCPVDDYQKIIADIEKYLTCPIVTMEDVVYGI